jgi:hypothetical protein
MKIIFLVSLPKKTIMVIKAFFLQDCFRDFDFWTFFLSIFEIPKILCPKINKNFTSGVGNFFGLIFADFLTLCSTKYTNSLSY